MFPEERPPDGSTQTKYNRLADVSVEYVLLLGLKLVKTGYLLI